MRDDTANGIATTGRPRIVAEVVFLKREEGGRVQMPVLGTNSHYMPHLVIERRENRKAIVDAGFVVQVVLDLIYYPQLSYSDIQPGATFTVREGLRIVAHGVVLNRLDPTE